MLAIYSRDLKGIILDNTYNVKGHYQKNIDNIINPNSTMYGAKLVKQKRVKSGISLIFKINWRGIELKPAYSFSKWYGIYFYWLFFLIKIENHYQTVYDYTIKDYLKEEGEKNNANEN